MRVAIEPETLRAEQKQEHKADEMHDVAHMVICEVARLRMAPMMREGSWRRKEEGREGRKRGRKEKDDFACERLTGTFFRKGPLVHTHVRRTT